MIKNIYALFFCHYGGTKGDNIQTDAFVYHWDNSSRSATCRLNGRFFLCRGNPGEMEDYMAFFASAITTLRTLVIALDAGLGVWGVVNLLEGYSFDNPGSNAHVR